MDQRWLWFNVPEHFFEEKSSWIQETLGLHGASFRFFYLAGKLIRLSCNDYELSNLVFIQAIVGFERALRLRFRAELEPFALLFARATAEGIVTDAALSEIRPLSESMRNQLEGSEESHCQALSKLVPKLRNSFVHGTYLLARDYIHLAVQMRELADGLGTTPAERA